MHVSGRPVTSFDPEGLIFAAGVDSEIIRLYDLRTFDRVRTLSMCHVIHAACRRGCLITQSRTFSMKAYL